MRFLFVDQITALGERQISGRRHYAVSGPMRYPGPTGAMQVAPGVVCEAIGQLASWYCLNSNQFTARQVFLFAERIEILHVVPVGSTLDLQVTIHKIDEESFVYSGEAALAGQVVQRIINCSGYFMPLAELEDPQETRALFAMLSSGGRIPSRDDEAAFDFASLAGQTLQLEAGQSIRTQLCFAADAPFYPDHFPRFPVTPIVILNEMIGQATATMLGVAPSGRLTARAIDDVKIRSFVQPGEPCEAIVQLRSRRSEGGHTYVETVAEIVKAGKRILRGLYQYEIVE